MAYRVYTAPMPKLDENRPKSHYGALISMFLIAMARPMRFMGYAGLFMLSGAHINVTHYLTWLPLVIGVILGVSIYWFGLVFVVAKLREKVTPNWIYKFSKIGAIVIVVIGVLSLLSLW